MNSLIVAVTLLLTIATALGLGIVLGYGAVAAILQIMAPRPESKPAAALVTAAHSGD